MADKSMMNGDRERAEAAMWDAAFYGRRDGVNRRNGFPEPWINDSGPWAEETTGISRAYFLTLG